MKMPKQKKNKGRKIKPPLNSSRERDKRGEKCLIEKL